MFSLKKLLGKDNKFFDLLEAGAEEARASVDLFASYLKKVMLSLLKDLCHGPYEAKELVILHELYELVEQAVDRCRNAGNIVVQIVLKHS